MIQKLEGNANSINYPKSLKNVNEVKEMTPCSFNTHHKTTVTQTVWRGRSKLVGQWNRIESTEIDPLDF